MKLVGGQVTNDHRVWLYMDKDHSLWPYTVDSFIKRALDAGVGDWVIKHCQVSWPVYATVKKKGG